MKLLQLFYVKNFNNKMLKNKYKRVNYHVKGADTQYYNLRHAPGLNRIVVSGQ